MRCNRFSVVLAIAAVTMLALAASANAAPVFVDPSFENGGSLTMGANYAQSGAGNNAASTLSTDVWHVRTVNHGQEGFLLEDKNAYKGFTSVPAGVSGEQFITGSRGNNFRGLFQYLQDNKATTGEIVATIDYWVHELNAADPVSGAGDFTFEVIAFDDPSTVNIDLGGSSDIATGSGFISSGGTYQTASVVDAATGFQERQAWLDLGASGYNYIGVVIGTSKSGLNPYNNASGNTASFDNLQVQQVDDGAGEPILYEGFNYSPGDIDGTQTGGTGFAATGWTTSNISNSNSYDVRSPGLSFTDLPTKGSSVARPSAPGGAEMNRPISAESQAALTGDDTTIWFSVLMNDREYAGRHAQGSLVLSTDPFTGPFNNSSVPPVMAGGEGFGVGFNGTPDNVLEVAGLAIDDGVSSFSADVLPDPDPSAGGNTTYLIAGKIEWAANGSDDVLRLFNIADPLAAEPVDGDAFATMMADLDQSLFDTIAIGDAQIGTFDEIRFATSFEEVMGRAAAAAVPEPSTFVLAALGLLGLGWYARRRR